MWYVYILKSINKRFVYIGSTNNLEERLRKHNAGLSQSTKAYAPYKIVAYMAVETEKQARALEKYFKTGSGKAVLYKRILGSHPLVDEALA
ncbi:MAG: putative endonuclease containing a URI domain [Bacteroidetes bacterium]|nr:MAG: putative endonuclease containing a URI domain [Bacteroidota bacterium]